MKNIIYLLSILLLFQSCYSYKAFDLKEYETVKPKKVKIELKDARKLKGKVTEIRKDIIAIKNYREIVEIPISQIEKIEKRKFSYLKTSLTVISALGLSFIIAISIVMKDFDIGSRLFKNNIKTQ